MEKKMMTISEIEAERTAQMNARILEIEADDRKLKEENGRDRNAEEVLAILIS